MGEALLARAGLLALPLLFEGVWWCVAPDVLVLGGCRRSLILAMAMIARPLGTTSELAVGWWDGEINVRWQTQPDDNNDNDNNDGRVMTERECFDWRAQRRETSAERRASERSSSKQQQHRLACQLGPYQQTPTTGHKVAASVFLAGRAIAVLCIWRAVENCA